MKIVLTLLVLACCSAYSAAQMKIIDGNSLQNQCAYMKQVELKQHLSEEDYGKALFCVGYIRASLDSIVVDGMMGVTLVTKDGKWEPPCIPQTVSNDQAIKVVMKYLDDNPAYLNKPAILLIRKAMKDAFPCQ